MSKVTSKLQVTIPKAIADKYGISPGDDVVFEPAGEVIRMHPTDPGSDRSSEKEIAWRLKVFDAATQRQNVRNRKYRKARTARESGERGWKREDLYDRDLSR